MAQVTTLNIFPVKSLRGIALDKALVGTRGLCFDREWLIIDHRNRFITQREMAKMATVGTRLTEQALVLSHDTVPDLVVPLDSAPGARLKVTVWRDHCDAIDAGDQASQWLTGVLGKFREQPVRLVRFASDAIRPVDPEFLGDDSSAVGFADGYPFLITVEESLQALNLALRERGQQAVPMSRFRANVVVRGLEAYAENRIAELGCATTGLRLALRKPCQRCKITTIDQSLGSVSPDTEPLRTLVATNPFPQQPGGYFGQNAILLGGAGRHLRVKDELLVSYRQAKT